MKQKLVNTQATKNFNVLLLTNGPLMKLWAHSWPAAKKLREISNKI